LTKKREFTAFYLPKSLIMTRMAPKKKKNKTFYGVGGTSINQKVYLVYNLADPDNKLVADGPFESLKEAKQVMQRYLSKGLCSWIATYNE
jgi:hypothetical protein